MGIIKDQSVTVKILLTEYLKILVLALPSFAAIEQKRRFRKKFFLYFQVAFLGVMSVFLDKERAYHQMQNITLNQLEPIRT